MAFFNINNIFPTLTAGALTFFQAITSVSGAAINTTIEYFNTNTTTTAAPSNTSNEIEKIIPIITGGLAGFTLLCILGKIYIMYRERNNAIHQPLINHDRDTLPIAPVLRRA